MVPSLLRGPHQHVAPSILPSLALLASPLLLPQARHSHPPSCPPVSVDSAAELGHEASRAAERAWDVLQGDPAASPASRDMGRVYDDALKAGKDAGAAARLMGRDVGRAAEDIGRRAEAGGQAVGRDVEQLGKDGGRVVRDLEEDEW